MAGEELQKVGMMLGGHHKEGPRHRSGTGGHSGVDRFIIFITALYFWFFFFFIFLASLQCKLPANLPQKGLNWIDPAAL